MGAWGREDPEKGPRQKRGSKGRPFSFLSLPGSRDVVSDQQATRQALSWACGPVLRAGHQAESTWVCVCARSVLSNSL